MELQELPEYIMIENDQPKFKMSGDGKIGLIEMYEMLCKTLNLKKEGIIENDHDQNIINVSKFLSQHIKDYSLNNLAKGNFSTETIDSILRDYHMQLQEEACARYEESMEEIEKVYKHLSRKMN